MHKGMQGLMDDAMAIGIACLLIAAIVVALILFRPWRRRNRHRRRHSRRARIDLFAGKPAEPDAGSDA